MNIFETYKKKIQDIVIANCKNLNIDSKVNFEGVVIEIPPQKFNFDLSSNVALVLAKKNKKSPITLGKLLRDIFLRDSNNF